MPQFYTKKKGLDATPPDIAERAVLEYKKQGSLRNVAAQFNISKSTLQRYVKSDTGITEHIKRVADYGSKFITSQLFTNEEEHLLADYITKSASFCYGLSKKGVREMAYQFGRVNKKSLPDSWEIHKCAGEAWMTGFMHRHPNLSIRKPEATSLSRCTSFNEKNVGDFFLNLRNVMSKYGFPSHSIYNCDETSLTTVQKPVKIVAPKGMKQVSRVTSAERGTLVTGLFTINAGGNTIPPFYVFPRVHFKDMMLRGALPGSVGVCHPSGWMTGPHFVDYLQHFFKFVKPTAETPALLIFDNHESHISIESLSFCKENNIVLLTFPPHCTDRLQPLDVSVFGPLKKYYDAALDQWMDLNPGKTITIYEIAELSAGPITKALNPGNILSGFQKTGICPYNPDVFTESDFLRSYATDRPDNRPTDNNSANDCIEAPGTSSIVPSSENPMQNTSIETNLRPSVFNESPTAGSSKLCNKIVSPEEIRPYPKAPPRKSKGGRKPAKTRVLTDTPIKNEIILRLREKELKKSKKEKKTLKAKKKLYSSDEDEEVIVTYDEESVDLHFSEDDEDRQLDFEEDMEDRNIQEDDFVVVKFATKCKIIYYVGQVQSSQSEGYSVKFLRRKRQTLYFSFPDVDDISDVMNEDILFKVVPEEECKGTERTGRIYLFNCTTLALLNDLR